MGNYFNPSNDNPLLHLWSLSLEEQFYFIWPLIIGLLYKINNGRGIFLLCIVLLAVSLLCSSIFINSDSLAQYAYFILPTRMMGLTIGAGLALIKIKDIKNNSNAFSILGISLLFSSLFFITNESFPGFYTLLPCIGAALIIITSQAKVTKWLLSNKVMTFLGKISFSLYMWHWPLLIFGKRFIEEHLYFSNNLFSLFIYSILLMLFSIFSYYYIESFFRKLRVSDNNTFIYLFVIPLLFLTATSLYITKYNGIPMRYGLTDKMTSNETLGCHGSLIKDFCYLSDHEKGKSNLLLIGDSHAGSMGHFVRLLSEKQEWSALSASAGGCSFFETKFSSMKCEKVKNIISDVLKDKLVSHIFIAHRYDKMKVEDVRKLFSYATGLAENGYKVIMIKQVPLLDKRYAGKNFLSKYLKGEVPKFSSNINMSFTKYNLLLDELTNSNGKIISLDLSEYFINNDGKYRLLDNNGYPLYFDDDHLSAYGSEWLYNEYSKSIKSNKLKSFLIAR